MHTRSLAPLKDHPAPIEVRKEWEQAVFRAGFSCLSWPVEIGGQGLGPLEEFVFAEECALAGAPEGLGRVGRLLTAPALLGHGTDEQRTRFLPGILEGRDIWCQGFSEPAAGSDLAGVRTSARATADGYVVQGQKVWTSFADYADWCLLLVRTGAAASRHAGLTMLALPMHQPGVSVRGIRQITGRVEFSEIFLDGAVAPVGCRVGAEGDGWAVAMTTLAAERGAGFGALVLKELADDVALLHDHCGGAHPPDALRRAHSRVMVFRWQIMRALERAAEGLDPFASSSILKLTWSELAQEIARLGLETNCRAHAARWRDRMLDVRGATIASGTSEIQRSVIGDRVLGLPR